MKIAPCINRIEKRIFSITGAYLCLDRSLQPLNCKGKVVTVH
jgi:hypothetical protein